MAFKRNSFLIFVILALFLNEIVATRERRGAGDPSENEVVPLLPMKETPGGGNDGFTLSGDPKLQKNVLEFRLANRLAVAVCDTYDNYLATGKPYTGQINYNVTVQTLRSPVPPTTCQSFKIKRCYGQAPDAMDKDCGWKKVPTC